jgi:hypothetical protein
MLNTVQKQILKFIIKSIVLLKNENILRVINRIKKSIDFLYINVNKKETEL